MDEVKRYLVDDPAAIGFAAGRKSFRSRLRARASSARTTFRLSWVRWSAPYWRRKAAVITMRGPAPKLNLGCGASLLAGWVNIDILVRGVDIPYDLSRGIPFPDGSCKAVVHEHVLEHMTTDSGLLLLCECYRVLAPGGVLRVGVPDFEAYARSYLAEGAGMIERCRPGRPSALLALQEVFYGHGHRAMYDVSTLRLLLEEYERRLKTDPPPA